MSKTNLTPSFIEQKILSIRGHRVMVASDLSELYGVTTKALNQAVKRNLARFPDDIMFQLNAKEKEEVVTNCDHLRKLKFTPYLPYVFTEHGALMLANVLNSPSAVAMSLEIVRVFVRVRQILATNKELAVKINELEKKTEKHDVEISAICEAIRQLITVPGKPKRKIGFH